MAIPSLNAADRRDVLDAVLRAVDTKFMGPDADTGALRATHEPLGRERRLGGRLRGRGERDASGPRRQPHGLLP